MKPTGSSRSREVMMRITPAPPAAPFVDVRPKRHKGVYRRFNPVPRAWRGIQRITPFRGSTLKYRMLYARALVRNGPSHRGNSGTAPGVGLLTTGEGGSLQDLDRLFPVVGLRPRLDLKDLRKRGSHQGHLSASLQIPYTPGLPMVYIVRA